MNKLKSVEIEGLWGRKSLKIDFNPDVNFLIGVNGSGKTTIINLIAAALSADFQTLDRLSFKTIRLEFTKVSGRTKATILVEKRTTKRSPYSNIEYKIKQKASDEFTIYSLDEFEEETLLRRQMPSRYYQHYISKMNKGVLASIKSMVNISWLSIHRGDISHGPREERSFESSIDQKLDELNTALVRYFSLLATKVADEIEEFQKEIIVSLLVEQSEEAVFSSVQKLDLDKEKTSLEEIFEKIGIKDKPSLKRLEKHFVDVQESLLKVKQEEALSIKDLMSIIGSFRSHRVVQEWNHLLKRQNSILRPRSEFLRVLNSLYQNKHIIINENNELSAKTNDGQDLLIGSLSSGEKQLLIIIGEALLQKNNPWIYIADEPELSLHVIWQERLIENLITINPEAQIICATHSPDIVSSYSKNVFDMEKLLT